MSKQRLRSVFREFSKRRRVKKQEHIKALSSEEKAKKVKNLKKGTIIADTKKQKDSTSGIRVLPRQENNFVNKPKKEKSVKKTEFVKGKKEPVVKKPEVVKEKKESVVKKPEVVEEKKETVAKKTEVVKEKKEPVDKIKMLQDKLDKKLEEINQAKTPKGADEDTRAEFNEKRKALRKERDALKKQIEALQPKE